MFSVTLPGWAVLLAAVLYLAVLAWTIYMVIDVLIEIALEKIIQRRENITPTEARERLRQIRERFNP